MGYSKDRLYQAVNTYEVARADPVCGVCGPISSVMVWWDLGTERAFSQYGPLWMGVLYCYFGYGKI